MNENQEKSSYSHTNLITQNTEKEITKGDNNSISNTVIYDNVTLADFYRKIDTFSEEERELALSLVKKINKIIGKGKKVKIENIILLAPILSELLKIANSSTDNRIKALNAAQKSIQPRQSLFVQQRVDVGSASTIDHPLLNEDLESSIFKDRSSSLIGGSRGLITAITEIKQVGAGSTATSAETDGVPIIHSPSYYKKNNGEEEDSK